MAEVGGLGLLSYIPLLVSSRGRVSGDTKQYLYLDPGALLARAPYLWDPHVGAGTVPHQQIGYLFPMGPWFWLFQQLGIPDWVAQRLWLGTISFAAALGARWLFRLLGTGRAGALAGAVVYALSPYQLAFTSGLSVLLLPWAGLPWLVGLTMRAVRDGGWRDPALFALVVLTIGGINASALVLAGIGPLLWLVVELVGNRAAIRAALAATARIAVLTVGVSLWWIVGLRLQGAYGLPVLRLTESLSTVADRSSPDDLLRGIGNWLLYTKDNTGYAVDQAAGYARGGWVGVTSYAVPVAALLAAAVVRWRHRAYAVLLIVIGTIIGAGAWPYKHPSLYGALWKRFADRSSLGLALRNSPRVVPVIALGVAALLAAGVGSLRSQLREVLAGFGVAALAVAALGPVWQTGFFSDGHSRPENLPAYVVRTAAAVDAGGDRTRVLELPGSNFATYTWGNTVEPVTPGLSDRPYLTREVLPSGSPASVNLLDALDGRYQQGAFEPASLAPLARLLGVGTVVVRSDLASDKRFGLRSSQQLWDVLTNPLAPGMRAPRAYGPAVGDPSSSPTELRPSVALFNVKDPLPIVRTAPVAEPIVLAGDGDGIVDAAAAGLVDGRALLLSLPAMNDRQLREALQHKADLVLTDSNRRRAQQWFFSVARNKGATERAGRDAPDPRGYDYRLQTFPGTTDTSRSVVEDVGGRVDATGDGGPARPEDRAVYAFDGDLRTTWRVGGEDPTGQRIVLHTDKPVVTDHVTLVQPQEGPRDRILTRVRLRLDNAKPVTVELGPRSLTARGQIVRFPRQSIHRLEIELVRTTTPPFDAGLANAVGFSEVRLGDVRVTETVRLPVDLAERTGSGSEGHRLDIVATRLRVDPADVGRQDEELRLDRRFVLPRRRAFGMVGTARVNPDAPDDVLDRVLGTTAPGATFSASGHLQSDLRARASRAFDHAPNTAWTAIAGPQRGQYLGVHLMKPVTVRGLQLTFLADGRHSVPARIRLEADGRSVATVALPKLRDGGKAGTTRTVRLPVKAVTARNLRLVIEQVDRRTAVPGDRNPAATLPVAIAEAPLSGVKVPAAPVELPRSCRHDLVKVDGSAVAVRLAGRAASARTGVQVQSCSGPLMLDAGSHHLRATAGLDSGIDLDRLVLSSDARGQAAVVGARGARSAGAGASATVRTSGPTSLDLNVRTDGKPFWIVLGESDNRGWAARTSDGTLGPRQLVDGYANGWLVRPSRRGTMNVGLEWKPQRLVWVSLALSAFAVLACIAILLLPGLRRRRMSRSPSPLADPPMVATLATLHLRPATPLLSGVHGVVTAAAVAAVSEPWIGVVSGLSVLLISRVHRTRWLVAVAAPAALVASRLIGEPGVAWLAIGLLVADLAGRRLWGEEHRAHTADDLSEPPEADLGADRLAHKAR